MQYLPKVSIVVAYYNGGQYWQLLWQSLLAQTLQNWELLLIDDGSTDGSVALLPEDPRIRVIQPTKKCGLPGTVRNHALPFVKGQYVAFLDCDDCWHPTKLARQVALLEAQPQAVFCFSQAPRFFGDAPQMSHRLQGKTKRLSQEQLARKNIIPTSSVMVRSQLLADSGGFFDTQDLRIGEDYDLWLRLAAKGYAIFQQDPLCYYRIHGNQITQKAARRGLRIGLCTIAQRCQEPQAKRLLWSQAHKTWALEHLNQKDLKEAWRHLKLSLGQAFTWEAFGLVFLAPAIAWLRPK